MKFARLDSFNLPPTGVLSTERKGELTRIGSQKKTNYTPQRSISGRGKRQKEEEAEEEGKAQNRV
jgi:hypothetical protein